MSNTTATGKFTEVKREEFRKYLEHTGVMDAITNVLIKLFEEHEQPDDTLEYIKKYFSFVSDINKNDNTSSEIETLKKELSEARSQISQLEEKLAKYELQDAA